MGKRHGTSGLALACAIALMAPAAAPAAPAAADYFLEIDGIKGESTQKGSEGDIDIESFSWGLNQVARQPGSGASAGKVNVKEISLTKRTDSTSPLLMVATAAGRYFKCAVLTGMRAGSVPLDFLRMRFTDVVITSYAIGAESETPTDQFSLAFAKVEMETRRQNVDGSAPPPAFGGWDFVRHIQFGPTTGACSR